MKSCTSYILHVILLSLTTTCQKLCMSSVASNWVAIFHFAVIPFSKVICSKVRPVEFIFWSLKIAHWEDFCMTEKWTIEEMVISEQKVRTESHLLFSGCIKLPGLYLKNHVNIYHDDLYCFTYFFLYTHK